MKTTMLIRTLVTTALITVGAAFAEIPEYIHFQGVLTDDAGLPVNDTLSMTFGLYSDTTVAASWDVTLSDVIVRNGFYEVFLEAGSLDFDVLYFLGIFVEGTQVGSKKPLASVPYSMRSAKTRVVPGDGLTGATDSAAVLLSIADGGVTSVKLAGGAVTNAKIQNAAISKSKIGAGEVVTELNGLTDELRLVEGNNITITAALDSIVISAADGAGADTDWVITGDSMHAGVSGEVGIGTDSPEGALHLKGVGQETLIIETDNNDGGSVVKLVTPGAESNKAEFAKWSASAAGTIGGSIPRENLTEISSGGSAGPLMMRVVNDTCMYFLTHNVERMRITSGGRIGIGTSTPSDQFSVTQSAHIGNNCHVEGNLTVVNQINAEDLLFLAEDVPILFGPDESLFFDIFTTRFELTRGLSLNGPLAVGRSEHWIGGFPFTSFSDTIIDPNDIELAMDSIGDVYIQEDLQVGEMIYAGRHIVAGGDLYTDGHVYAGENVYVGHEVPGDFRILFGETASESLYWDDSEDRFQLSEKLAVDGTIHGGAVGPAFGDSTSYSALVISFAGPQGGDMGSGGDLFLGADLEVRQNIYYSGSLTDISPVPTKAKNVVSSKITTAQATDVLNDLTPMLYRYSDTEDGKTYVSRSKIGFNPSELPELVTAPDGKGYRPLDIIALLTRVVQEQQATIDDLQSRLEAVENGN